MEVSNEYRTKYDYYRKIKKRDIVEDFPKEFFFQTRSGESSLNSPCRLSEVEVFIGTNTHLERRNPMFRNKVTQATHKAPVSIRDKEPSTLPIMEDAVEPLSDTLMLKPLVCVIYFDL